MASVTADFTTLTPYNYAPNTGKELTALVETFNPGASSDVTAPAITGLTPVDMSELTAETPIAFTVDDIDSDITKVLVFIQYNNTPNPVLVYDGTNFLGLWAYKSTVSGDIDVGYTFSILPLGGWLSGFELSVFAGDAAGNLDSVI